MNDDKEQPMAASASTAWHIYAAQKFELQERRMDALEIKLDENRAATARVEESTEGMVAMMRDWDGALKVIERIGKVLKPLTLVIAFCSALVGLWIKTKGYFGFGGN